MLRTLFQTSAYVNSIFQTPFVEETVFSQWNYFRSFLKDQSVVHAWMNFWGLCFVPLFHMSIFMLVADYFDYNSPCDLS